MRKLALEKRKLALKKRKLALKKRKLALEKEEVGTRKDEVGTHEKYEENHDHVEKENHNDLTQRLLKMIEQDNRVSRKKMAEKLSTSERTIQRILNTMTSIRFVGKGKNGHWELIEKE